ncbi:phospholipase D-like domain-containing protein [Falsihalocynthiibacter sp. BN13B15]|uniref:phospholipase D-like domain-containing protein n=1 Tax=Falsihalocynthiibacter sp. BN13B15 TaxID=3240871 RepID=UPI00350FBD2C
MAKVSSIFQPLTAADVHAIHVNKLLSSPWANRFTLSSAFLNSSGVLAFSASLLPVAHCTRFFIGIRNGSTTAQGISQLLKAGAEVYAVDTATKYRLFHPKAFVASGPDSALAIVGSANLTHAGLHNNIEIGARLELDLNNHDDALFHSTLLDQFDDLPVSFPMNCFKISSARQIVELMGNGHLEDERDQTTQTVVGVAKHKGKISPKPKINLPSVRPAKLKIRRKKHVIAPPPIAGVGATKAVPHYGNLVWEKPNIPRGDLQLLNVGHGSGVLRLTQARFEVNGARIDQTTYFRNKVFSNLPWSVDPVDPGKETASATFALVVQGVYAGDFELRLSHKPAWEAGQGNYTTGLHWEDAKPVISRPGLIGGTLRLFNPAIAGGAFIIEID